MEVQALLGKKLLEEYNQRRLTPKSTKALLVAAEQQLQDEATSRKLKSLGRELLLRLNLTQRYSVTETLDWLSQQAFDLKAQPERSPDEEGQPEPVF